MKKVVQLEALLFAEGAEMKKKDLMALLDLDVATLEYTSRTLSQVLSGRGITLVESDSTLALRTAPDIATFIKEIHQKSIEGDVGMAALETLSILLYAGPSSCSEIDYIRGVNSSSTIRSLLVRGLIEREKAGGSSYIYKPTVDALAMLGVNDIADLPDFIKMREELKELRKDLSR